MVEYHAILTHDMHASVSHVPTRVSKQKREKKMERERWEDLLEKGRQIEDRKSSIRHQRSLVGGRKLWRGLVAGGAMEKIE